MNIKMTVISIDDNMVNLLLVEALAKDLGLDVKSFASARESLEYMQNHSFDIVITDYMMPEMHGIDLIKEVRKNYSEIPIVMITAVTDNNDLKIEALEAGATEFLNKPMDPTEFKARILNLTRLRKAQVLLQDKALFLEEEVRKAVHLIQEREREALYVLGRAAEYKDPETGSHINRVALYSRLIMEKIGGSEKDQEMIFYSAPLHDVGKIGIPDSILTKPGFYTTEEFEIMKKHPIIGYEMLKEGKNLYLQSGAEIALTHHEKYNGTGYPYGTKGEEIPLNGRILAVADVFDALTTHRPYKEPWPIEKAVELLLKERGEHFDPYLVDIFVKHMDEVKVIYETHKEEPTSNK